MDDWADESWFVHMPNHVKHRSSEQHATKESSRSSPFRISVDEFWFQSTTTATLSISLKCYFDLSYVIFSLHFIVHEKDTIAARWIILAFGCKLCNAFDNSALHSWIMLPNFCRDLVSFLQKFVKLICYWAHGNGYWWLEIVYRNLGNFFTELREIIAEICRYWYCSRACNFVSNQPSLFVKFTTLETIT